MYLGSTKEIVGTIPSVLFTFVPSDLVSVAFQADASVEIGVGGVSTGHGYPIAAGGSFGFNQLDLDTGDNRPIRIYAVATAATTVRVLSFRRGQ